jgi:hypothetical protein
MEDFCRSKESTDLTMLLYFTTPQVESFHVDQHELQLFINYIFLESLQMMTSMKYSQCEPKLILTETCWISPRHDRSGLLPMMMQSLFVVAIRLSSSLLGIWGAQVLQFRVF